MRQGAARRPLDPHHGDEARPPPAHTGVTGSGPLGIPLQPLAPRIMPRPGPARRGSVPRVSISSPAGSGIPPTGPCRYATPCLAPGRFAGGS